MIDRLCYWFACRTPAAIWYEFRPLAWIGIRAWRYGLTRPKGGER